MPNISYGLRDAILFPFFANADQDHEESEDFALLGECSVPARTLFVWASLGRLPPFSSGN
jgi:hypothetical protein